MRHIIRYFALGQGFPKGGDISKLIDKQNKDNREVIGHDNSRSRANRHVTNYSGGVVEMGGGIYKGEMREGNLHIVLFDSPDTRTTLALFVDMLKGPDAVAKHIAASNTKFGKPTPLSEEQIEALREEYYHFSKLSTNNEKTTSSL